MPVLFHFLFLRRARIVEFSDLTLLRAAYLRSLPSSRLRQWLLLAARCLILACLILAFARPVRHPSAVRAQGVARSQAGAGEEEAVHMVVLADVSYSMGLQVLGKTRLEAAQNHGQALLRLLRPQDRVAVAGFSDRLESLKPEGLAWEADAPAAQAALRRLKLSSRPTDFSPPLEAAYRFLKSSSAKRRVIVLLSDNAAHGWRAQTVPRLAQSVPDYDPSVVLLALDRQDFPDNAAILAAALEDSGENAELSVRVGLEGPPRPGWDLDLWRQDQRVDRKPLKLEAPELSASFKLRPPLEASCRGRLELRKDRLAADDTFFYSFWMPRRPKVLLVHGGPRSFQVGRGGYFLKKLFLEGQGSILPYSVEIADSLRARELRLSDYQAILLIDFRKFSEELAVALERYVKDGGGLWVIPAKMENPGAYKALAGILPARLGEAAEASGNSQGIRADREEEPLSSEGRFSWKDFELQNVLVRRSYALAPERGARTWLRDSQARPLWVFGSYGEGQVLLWGSSLDFTWTDIAVKPVFAAWVDFGLSRLTRYSKRRAWRVVDVGEPILRVWALHEPAPASVLIRGPGDKTVLLQVRDRRVEYIPEQPGLYRLEGASSEEEVYAANLDRDTREWDLAPGLPSSFRMLKPDSLQADFLRAVYGEETRTAFLFLLLVFLVLETYLSQGRRLRLLLIAGLFWGSPGPVHAQEGDKFVWTQVRYDGAWDPYPGVHAEILRFVSSVTSILTVHERRVITLKDPALFASPFVVLTGRTAPPILDDEELSRLRRFLTSGGFLWIEDVSGAKSGSFDRWVRQTLKLVFPDSDLTPLGSDHVIYKTFFLVRGVGGRVSVSGALEGIDWGGHAAVVYSRNDIFGAWAKDALGHFLYECVPGGENQRMNARKLALNLVMYSLTGSYKTDAVHQPFLLEKMRQGLVQ